jgi:hypothetical protein
MGTNLGVNSPLYIHITNHHLALAKVEVSIQVRLNVTYRRYIPRPDIDFYFPYSLNSFALSEFLI